MKIRGQGLSYSYNMFNHVEQGLLHFSFYKSEDVWAAYAASKVKRKKRKEKKN